MRAAVVAVAIVAALARAAAAGTCADGPACEKACGDGDAAACNWGGVIYEQGRGVAADRPRAEKLYERGCKAKVEESCRRRSRMLQYDQWSADDSTVDPAKERCAKGDGDACHTLAVAVRNDEGDIARAMELDRKACDAGSWRGCQWLAKMYEDGINTAPDLARALALYKRACDGGYSPGCEAYATGLERGYGGKPDHAAALAQSQKVCVENVADGCVRVGRAYRDGLDVKRDLALAIAAFERGCDKNVESACYELGVAYRDAVGVKKDDKKAASMFDRACARKEAVACKALGDELVTSKNPDARTAAYSRACDNGAPLGCLEAADGATTATWREHYLKLGCAHGDSRACSRVQKP